MTTPPAKRHRLSKSRFAAGYQCHKLLWWKVHEPDAVELQPGKVLMDRFDQARHAGELAREQFPGGILIDIPHHDIDARLTATSSAINERASFIFEAAFQADDVFVAVDILSRNDDAFDLVEVKSASSQKNEHITDAAIQTHVLRRCGLDVQHTEIMHLNKEYRFPYQGDLFQRTDVTTPVEHFLHQVPEEITAQLGVINGPQPDVAIGPHCFEPRECPFKDRCWPDVPNHISTLYNVGPKKTWEYMQQGVHTIADIPPEKKLPPAARRQLRALELGKTIVEPTLAEALQPFTAPLGYLDFETVARAIPVWPGLAPWGQAAAQFSYHEEAADGTVSHCAYLAEGPEDTRHALAEALVQACAGASRVVTYTSFEKTRIRALQRHVPDLAEALADLESRLIDLHPVIRDNVYHPKFMGSFSLKYILNPLVPELTYNDLIIVDGLVASVEIARLLFVADKIAPEERDRTRQDLLDYCERDTWAMVRLLWRLRELGSGM